MKGMASERPCRSYRGYAKQWRGVGLNTAFFISLFIFSFSHQAFRLHEDHLWAHLLYQTEIVTIETALHLVMVVSSNLIALGLFISSLGWKEIHRGGGEMVATGLYSIMRHPQYLGLILIIIAFLIRWPTLPTLLFAPISSGNMSFWLDARMENLRGNSARISGVIEKACRNLSLH